MSQVAWPKSAILTERPFNKQWSQPQNQRNESLHSRMTGATLTNDRNCYPIITMDLH